jgi:DNA (cytosine-5)-methyltransferase 1
MTTLKMVDLFCGTGGFSYALRDIATTVFANDKVKESKIIYEKNFKNHNFVLKDLLTIENSEIPEHDILTGGFPCQPFSVAGERKGFDDERSGVFWKIIDILKHHTPRFVILENVKNILTHDKGGTMKTVLKNLTDIGYRVKYRVLNTSVYTGIPQNRERLYFVCFKNEVDYNNFNLDFDKVECKKISDFLDLTTEVDKKYYYTESSKIYDRLKEIVIEKDVVYQYRRGVVRENKSGVCPTLVASAGTGGHNVPIIVDDFGIRKLTPKECFLLQGLDYNLSGLSDAVLYKLAGNAITVNIVKLISDKLKRLLLIFLVPKKLN